MIESALPQLGGEFDYLIPEQLRGEIELGSRVSVPIGKAKKLATGFVTEILESSQFARRELHQVLGEPMLASDVLASCRTAAKRQVVTLGELLRSAAPAFMPSQPIPSGFPATKALPQFRWHDWRPPKGYQSGSGVFLSSPSPASVDGQLLFDWATLFLSASYQHLESGESSLIVVPEAADFQPVLTAARVHGIEELVVPLDDKRNAVRYQQFWLAKKGAPRIYLGTRSAVLHPAKNLALIAVFDDLDESLRSRSSPYLHAREFALIRAQASDARVIIAAHYRSLEAQRLISIGFAKELANQFRPPRLSHFESGTRLPSEFFSLVRSSLEQGSVLVLVPNRHWSVVARCSDCGESIRCATCGAPAHMPTQDSVECRLCSARAISCSECGCREFKQGRAGAARITAELGRAFPGTVVRDFSGSVPKTRVGSGDIVVATPSAAPRLIEGYAAVAVVDCQVWLSRATLRSEQFAIRDWQEAIALLSPTGRAALFGVPATFGRLFALQDFVRHATEQLREMGELRLPPAWRICRLSGETQLLREAIELATRAGGEVLSSPGIPGQSGRAEVLLRFRYSDGPKVSDALQEISLRSSLKGAAAGRRRLKISMDDFGEL